MKICYINPAGYGLLRPSYVNKQSYGGAEAAMFDDAKLLAKDKQFEMHMLIDADEEKKFRQHDINVWTIKGCSTNNLEFIPYRLAFWRKLREINADIYVQRASLRELYFLTGLFCKLHGKKYIHVLSESLEANKKDLKKASFAGKFRWITMMKTALQMANAVVVLSHQQLNDLTPTVQRKTTVIYNGKQIVKKVKPYEKRKYVLWAGRNHPIKRPELFLKLAQNLPKEKFAMAIIGDVPKNVPPNVKILKNVPKEKMNALFANARILVHTSLTEGFGNVFIEAWNNETPVVTTVDTDECVCKHDLGYHSRNFEQLVKDVRKAINDKKKWKIQSRNARTYVRKHHDITRQIKEYKKLFLSLQS